MSDSKRLSKDELLTYLETVKNLESAVYTNSVLRPKCFKKMKSLIPVKPDLSKITVAKPIPPEDKSPSADFAIIVMVGITMFIFGLTAFRNKNGDQITGFMGILIAVLGAIIFFLGIQASKNAEERKKKFRIAEKKYQQSLIEYRYALIDNNRINEEKKREYERQVKVYEQRLEWIKRYVLLIQKNFNDVSEQLENALNSLYDMDIIFPKYRNFVAVCAMYEYIASGRCDSLEGANGAYNIFEMEMRQNIIIGHLEVITENLELIKLHQYTMYQEINKCNAIVDEQVKTIDSIKETKIITYFKQTTSLALNSRNVLK